jgi:hypothetical protein
MTDKNMDWIVSCRDPFIDVVVNAATKQDAATDVLSDKKYVNFNLEKLRTLILEGKEEGYYVEQFCLPKEAKTLFAANLLQLLSEIEHEFSRKGKISDEYRGKVYTLTNLLQHIAEFYHSNAIYRMRLTAELMIEKPPHSLAQDKYTSEHSKFASKYQAISDVLRTCFLTDEVQTK